MYIQGLTTALEKIVLHLKENYAHIQLGRASTSLIENLQIYVPSRGTTTPLNGLANVSVLDPQTIKIEAYSKGELKVIEKGIIDADIGFNPLNQGDYIMIKIPPMTTERRTEFTKIVNKDAEEAKVAIRNARHELRNEIDKQFKAKELSENEKTTLEKQIDDLTKKYNDAIDTLAKTKNDDIMKV